MTCSTASNSGKFAWRGVGIGEGTTLKGITFRLSDFFNKRLEHESGFYIATPCIAIYKFLTRKGVLPLSKQPLPPCCYHTKRRLEKVKCWSVFNGVMLFGSHAKTVNRHAWKHAHTNSWTHQPVFLLFRRESKIIQVENSLSLITNIYYEKTLRCTSEEFQPWKIFQQDDARPKWGSHVRRSLDATFPNRWIGRDGPKPWPPGSPDITPLITFYWGMLRTKCFLHQFQILQIWRQE